ncbi:hypothetical protein C9I49_12415 [Pseudomonas prosekii]|uniref:Uncharacterized protein n=1 Tax=Pseudomonas prosekii TaxID=1148509 RepID=A0A2U2D887_9PSED|nr:hypothetical protein C9I49_12415 [Pseudomonas prosekii]
MSQLHHLWRGGLPPLDCAAIPFFQINRGAAARPNGGKPPRHKNFLCHKRLRATKASLSPR